MKGIIEAILGYLYVVIGLVVGLLLLTIIFKFSGILTDRQDTLGQGEMEAAQTLAEVSADCWKNHRQGLDSESGICKTLKTDLPVKVTEKNMTRILDCTLLPNSNCYPDDCKFCSSEYYEDTDKILWFIEESSSEIKITYSGKERKIKLLGSPCDKTCLCNRKCKEYCIDLSVTCEDICTYDKVMCYDCKQNMESVCSDCFEMCGG